MRRLPSPARSILVALVGALGFTTAYVVGVQTLSGQSVEERVLDISVYAEHSALLGLVSVPSVAIACILVTAIGLIRRKWADAATAAGIMVVSNVLGQLLKYELLDRPALIIDAINTFPSGHTIVFTSTLLALLLVLPRPVRLIVMPFAALVISVVGVQLLLFGWHRPSDVLGGICLVVAVAGILNLIRVLASRPVSERAISGFVLKLVFAIACLAGAAAVIAAALYVVGPLREEGAPLKIMAYGSVVAVACAATTVMVWMLHAPRRRSKARGR